MQTIIGKFPGTPAAVGRAREFVIEALNGCARADDVVLLVSELASNAVRHTLSGLPDGTFEVDVILGPGVRVEVHDGGGPSIPCARKADDDAMGGRGIAIMEALADRWGYARDSGGTVVWFELDALAAAN